MEKIPNFESGESIIDNLIEGLADREGMSADDILSDIITFAPYEGNDAANPDYLEELASLLGISVDEMIEYAMKKAKEQFGE